MQSVAQAEPRLTKLNRIERRGEVSFQAKQSRPDADVEEDAGMANAGALPADFQKINNTTGDCITLSRILGDVLRIAFEVSGNTVLLFLKLFLK